MFIKALVCRMWTKLTAFMNRLLNQSVRNHGSMLFETLEPRVLMSVVKWVGGADPSWTNGSNWQDQSTLLNHTPAAGDDVLFDTNATITVAADPAALNSLKVSGATVTLSFNYGTDYGVGPPNEQTHAAQLAMGTLTLDQIAGKNTSFTITTDTDARNVMTQVLDVQVTGSNAGTSDLTFGWNTNTLIAGSINNNSKEGFSWNIYGKAICPQIILPAANTISVDGELANQKIRGMLMIDGASCEIGTTGYTTFILNGGTFVENGVFKGTRDNTNFVNNFGSVIRTTKQPQADDPNVDLNVPGRILNDNPITSPTSSPTIDDMLHSEADTQLEAFLAMTPKQNTPMEASSESWLPDVGTWLMNFQVSAEDEGTFDVILRRIDMNSDPTNLDAIPISDGDDDYHTAGDDLNCDSDSTIEINLGGVSDDPFNATRYDVAGDATLAGTLTMAPTTGTDTTGYESGDKFTIMDVYGHISGNFDNAPIDTLLTPDEDNGLPVLAEGLYWQLNILSAGADESGHHNSELVATVTDGEGFYFGGGDGIIIDETVLSTIHTDDPDVTEVVDVNDDASDPDGQYNLYGSVSLPQDNATLITRLNGTSNSSVLATGFELGGDIKKHFKVVMSGDTVLVPNAVFTVAYCDCDFQGSFHDYTLGDTLSGEQIGLTDATNWTLTTGTQEGGDLDGEKTLLLTYLGASDADTGPFYLIPGDGVTHNNMLSGTDHLLPNDGSPGNGLAINPSATDPYGNFDFGGIDFSEGYDAMVVRLGANGDCNRLDGGLTLGGFIGYHMVVVTDSNFYISCEGNDCTIATNVSGDFEPYISVEDYNSLGHAFTGADIGLDSSITCTLTIDGESNLVLHLSGDFGE